MNRVRTEEETGIEEEKSESIPVFVCVKTDFGRWREAEVGRWATAYGQTAGASGIKLKYR